MQNRHRTNTLGGRSVVRAGRRSTRRGSSHVIVLSLATVLTVVGISAITVSRVRTKGSVQANEWTDAQMLASSASEHALTTINDDPDWRANLAGQTIQRTINGKTFSWQVVDEADGDLADDPTDPITLRVTGAAGQAAYSLKIDLALPSDPVGSGGSGGSGTPDKTLWGVDEDDGMLFSIDDYTSTSAQVTRYGKLKYRDSCNHVRELPHEIESFTIDTDGYAYMVLNDWLGSLRYPILLRFNLANASTSQDNIVEVIGRIDWNSDICGIDFDPTSGKLYAMGYAGSSHGDRLLVINKATGSIIDNVGEMKQGGTKVKYGEGLAFNADGLLYVIDDDHDRLYRINKATARIEETVDEDMTSSGHYEAIAWDPVNNRMLGSNTGRHELFEVTFRDGHNVFWFDLDDGDSLKDVEGFGFKPSTSTEYSSTAVRPSASSSAITRVVESN